MARSGEGKRSKKARQAKRDKAARRAQLRDEIRQAVLADLQREREQAEPGDEGEATLSPASQAVVIELQRTELSRLLREQARLNERIDQLMRLHEREQVLRQQMQTALDRLTAERSLPPPPRIGEAEEVRLLERVRRAEGKFNALRSAVGQLVVVLERRSAPAH